MGFRFGWFGKWGGGTWGPKGGLRLYGMVGGRRTKTGCLIPFIVLGDVRMLRSLGRAPAKGVLFLLGLSFGSNLLTCTLDVRSWDRLRKLTAPRHPVNGYRLYRREDVEPVPEDLGPKAKG